MPLSKSTARRGRPTDGRGDGPRFNLRLSAHERRMLESAAAREKLSLSEFCRRAMMERGRAVLAGEPAAP